MVIYFEGVGFSKEWVAGKTFTEFCEHEKHHGLTKQQLKEVYNLCAQKINKEKP
jgi:hypothetical protein